MALSMSALTSHAAVTFSDSTFPNADWTAVKILDTTATQNATISISQKSSGGNPGFYQQDVLHWTSSGGTSEGLRGGSLFDSSVYNPSVSGMITSISYSFDRIFISAQGSTPGVFFALLLFQNNSYYLAGNAESDISNTNWTATSGSSLLSSNFSKVAGAGPSTPDFSTTAAPLTFGYEEGTAVGSAAITVTITTGVDNFDVTVNNVPVPEPGTWAIGALATGLLGFQILRGAAYSQHRSNREL